MHELKTPFIDIEGMDEQPKTTLEHVRVTITGSYARVLAASMYPHLMRQAMAREEARNQQQQYAECGIWICSCGNVENLADDCRQCGQSPHCDLPHLRGCARGTSA